MSKSNKTSSAELEPFRTSMAGKMAMAPGYEFKFYKPTGNSGGVVITDLDDKVTYKTGYMLFVHGGKCEVSVNLNFKPFNIPDVHKLNFDTLDQDLTRLLEFVK